MTSPATLTCRRPRFTPRGALGALGNALSYLGPVLVLLGLVVTQYLGWREANLDLAPGQQVGLAQYPVSPSPPWMSVTPASSP
ncbi:MAG: hypothetical protein HZY76_05775 [Anaerolineae bacterium]|nr:MAG: hypothetical protein HZY76_05775 [Anaerolineae bacterium]